MEKSTIQFSKSRHTGGIPGLAHRRQADPATEGDSASATVPGQRFLPAGLSRPAAGSWRVDPARSQASFAARAAGRRVSGCLPLTGRVFMAEPIEDSTVRLAA